MLPVVIHGNPGGAGNTGPVSGTVVSDEIKSAVTGNRTDQTGTVHFADPVVAAVGDVQVVVFIECQAERFVESRFQGWHVVAVVAVFSVTRKSLNDAFGVHFADAVVGAVGDVQVTLFVDHHPGRQVETGLGCGSAVAAESRRAVTCNRGDDSLPVDFTYSMIGPVRDIKIALPESKARPAGQLELRFRLQVRRRRKIRKLPYPPLFSVFPVCRSG